MTNKSEIKPNPQRDIETIEDIQLFVDVFYQKVRADELLGPIFNGIIQDKWPLHLEKMYRFWQTVLFEEHTYFGSPFPPHATMPLTQIHFERWLFLFTQTLNSLFIGERVNRAKWQGKQMATVFLSKIQYIQSHPIS